MAAKGMIVINEELCKGCERCVIACPWKLIFMAEHFNPKGYHPAVLKDEENKCTGCGICFDVCPEAMTITVYKAEKEKKEKEDEGGNQ